MFVVLDRFRREMKELEVMVENLLGEVFVTINSVTEGIDVLQNMYQYSKRKNLAAEFEKRTVKVRSHYKYFMSNTNSIK